VIADDGHTYERAAIERWFTDHATSPVTNEPVPTRTVRPNYSLKSLIREWKEEQQGEAGRQQRLKAHFIAMQFAETPVDTVAALQSFGMFVEREGVVVPPSRLAMLRRSLLSDDDEGKVIVGELEALEVQCEAVLRGTSQQMRKATAVMQHAEGLVESMEAATKKLEDDLEALKAKVREAKEAPVRMRLVAQRYRHEVEKLREALGEWEAEEKEEEGSTRKRKRSGTASAGPSHGKQSKLDGSVLLDEALAWDPANLSRSRVLAELASQAGDACAKGLCLQKCWGEGQVNTKKAFIMFKKQAEQGSAAAQYCVGTCYDDGVGVAEDKAKAAEWYRKSAAQEYAAAQCNLGWCYDSGEGVAEDKIMAVEWYRKSAEQGYAGAQASLGCCYEHGEGVAEDKIMAVEWYRKSAEQGNAEAQASYSRMQRCH